jgi:hypothetical protein
MEMMPSGNLGSSSSERSLNFVMVVKLTDNEALRLLGLAESTSPAALALADDFRAFLSGGDAVLVRLKNALGNPANHCCVVLFAVELCDKLLLELFDV